jgi:hypothetical protein
MRISVFLVRAREFFGPWCPVLLGFRWVLGFGPAPVRDRYQCHDTYHGVHGCGCEPENRSDHPNPCVTRVAGHEGDKGVLPSPPLPFPVSLSAPPPPVRGWVGPSLRKGSGLGGRFFSAVSERSNSCGAARRRWNSCGAARRRWNSSGAVWQSHRGVGWPLAHPGGRFRGRPRQIQMAVPLAAHGGVGSLAARYMCVSSSSGVCSCLCGHAVVGMRNMLAVSECGCVGAVRGRAIRGAARVSLIWTINVAGPLGILLE